MDLVDDHGALVTSSGNPVILGLLQVQVHASGGQEPSKTLETLLVMVLQQLNDALVHDQLCQYLQLKQLSDELLNNSFASANRLRTSFSRKTSVLGDDALITVLVWKVVSATIMKLWSNCSSLKSVKLQVHQKIAHACSRSMRKSAFPVSRRNTRTVNFK